MTVAIPVKDGARYLREVLTATFGQTIDVELEVLVIDSGSRDGSQGIATRAGARVVEIPAHEFGHGRTRNLAFQLARGRYVAFLTQDATPAHDRWLEHLVSAFELDRRVGLVFGPHLPRPRTSPMIARELTQFFTGMSQEGAPSIEYGTDETWKSGPAFFSNVNSCIRRDCWEEIRFRDLPYSEDQAFARDALTAGWSKVYEPRAGVLHAHDFGPVRFMKRYFDEYRGLRATVGHVETANPRQIASTILWHLRADDAFMRANGYTQRERARWLARGLVHYAGRAAFSALGSRAEKLPAPLQRALSLEGWST